MTTLLEKMFWACAEPLSLAAELASSQNLPTPDELQRRISGLFEGMRQKARAAQIPDEDIEDAKYAIVAFMDEQVFHSPWPGRQMWISRPLQLVYFNENTAGEGFFTRLQALQAEPRRAHVLEIYYLCLALGFQGKYAVHAGEGLGGLIDHVGAQVAAQLPMGDVISPRGEPQEGMRNFVQRELPIVALSLGFFALALLLFLVMKLVVVAGASSAATRMNQSAVGAGVVQKP